MNKAELIRVVSQRTGLPLKDTELTVNAALDTITEALAADDKVVFKDFGSFEVRTRAPRMGRNAAKNEAVEIPASNVPVFKPGKGLKDAVKGE